MSDLIQGTVIIAGVHRCATTTLFNELARHPQISPSTVKESNFFLPARYGAAVPSRESYWCCFSQLTPRTFSLEASPGYYCGGRAVAEAIKDVLPEAKIIVVLREPVARCESFYAFMHSILAIPRDMSFQSYVEECFRLSGGPSLLRENDMYRGLEDGRYAGYYAGWRESFGDQLTFAFYEDIGQTGQQVTRRLAAWIGISEAGILRNELRTDNARAGYRSPRLQRAALAVNIRYEPLFRKHSYTRRALRSVYRALNGSPPVASEAMEIRERLGEYYQESNSSLAALLSQDYPSVALPKWLQGLG